MQRKSWFLLGLGFIVVTAVALAQSVFPVRLDRDEPMETVSEEIAATGTLAVHTSAIYLPPRDSEPFACTTERIGFMYHQCVTFNFAIIGLCTCNDDPDDMTGPYWALPSGQTCASVATACSNVP